MKGNTIDVVDDATVLPAEVDVLTGHQAAVDEDVIYPPSALPGGIDKRWNILAFAAFALYMHDGGVDAVYTIEDQSGGANYNPVNNEVHLQDPKKWVYAHELGHAVSEMVTGDTGWLKAEGSDVDNCDGVGDGSSSGHNWLSKEWQSNAAIEGIADWYATITWNIEAEGDCEIGYWGGPLDYDLDGTNEVISAGNGSPCFGDPHDPVPIDFISGNDWLEDVVLEGAGNPTDGYCFDNHSPLMGNRSTEYDWVKYFWDMTSVQDYTIADMWAIWDEAGPDTWDPRYNTPSTADDPWVRMNTAAHTGLGFGNTHWTAASAHGLDH